MELTGAERRARSAAGEAFGLSDGLDPYTRLMRGKIPMSRIAPIVAPMMALSNSVFAFPLNNPSSKDSVPLITLTPGQYTAVASIGSGPPDAVLLEGCEVP